MSIDAQAALASASSALQAVSAAVAEKDASLSALSLQVDSLTAANIGLQAQLDTANQTIVDLKAQLDAIKPPAPKTVKDYGAVDGAVCNAAFRNAIAAGDGRVPAGTYLIDPLDSIVLGPGQRLVMDADAVLVLKPNAAPRYCGIRVEGGSLSGGQIIGDRLSHTYTAGSTHEWGYGAQVRGSGSSVSNIRISRCTGDGLGVSGSNHEISNVVSTENRRQGLSMFACQNVRVTGCEFSKTGALQGNPGTNPRCGIDIEPDAGWVENVLIENCISTGNEVTGLVGWIRSEVNGGIRGLTIRNCTIQGVNAMHFKALAGSISAAIEGCQIKRGNGVGIKVEAGATVAVNDSTFATPSDRADFTLTGMDSRTKYDIQVLAGGKALAGTNRFV